MKTRTLTFDYPRYIETNEDRAAMVRPYYEDYGIEHFGGEEPFRIEERENINLVLADLVADVLHLAHQLGADTEYVLDKAHSNFLIELDEAAQRAAAEEG